jgi:PAS domain-containing protein
MALPSLDGIIRRANAALCSLSGHEAEQLIGRALSEFVRGCLLSATDRLLLEAVVMLARGLWKRTVAKRTPDRATLRFLASLGVDLSQSYTTGRPTPLGVAQLLGACEEQPTPARAPRL